MRWRHGFRISTAYRLKVCSFSGRTIKLWHGRGGAEHERSKWDIPASLVAHNQTKPMSDTYTTRSLPFSLGAEKSVLSSAFKDSAETLPLAIESRLTPEHFYLPAHAMLFETLIAFHNEGKEIELVSFVQHMLDNGKLERIGGPSYLTEIYNYAPAPIAFDSHLAILHEKHLLRSLINISTAAIQEAYDSPESGSELLTDIEAKLTALRESRPVTSQYSAVALAREILGEFQALVTTGRELKPGMPTGFVELDQMTGGLRAGELFIIAARPSMGKTALMANIVENVALGTDRSVLVFSCEMSARDVARRIAHSRSRVTKRTLSLGTSTPKHEIEKFQRALVEIGKSKLVIDDTAAISISELRAKAMMANRKNKLSLVAVDYMQLMKSNSKQAVTSREREISDISAGLKSLAKELQIPVIALAQLNRDSEKRSGSKKGVPRMSDLRESGSIEQDADIVALLHRDAYFAEDEKEREETEGHARLIIAKNRNGQTGEVPLTFIADIMRFESGQAVKRQQPAREFSDRY